VRDILTHCLCTLRIIAARSLLDMRQAGHVPAYTDFIHGVRQGLEE
jgi:hypothetical protein